MGYYNRELSWLSFNERVLQEAEDKSVPLTERMRFLGIFSNNLDEFFRVRVAGLTRLSDLGAKTKAKFDEDPADVLAKVGAKIRTLQTRRDEVYTRLKKEFNKEGIEIISHENILSENIEELKAFFYQVLRPKLVPIMLDQVNEFPSLEDKEIYLLVKLELENGGINFSLIEIPDSIDRFYVINSSNGTSKVIYIDDIIRFKLSKLFRTLNLKQVSSYTIKITRDAELDYDDDFSKGVMEKMEKSVKKRKKGDYVRLLYDKEMPEDMLVFLKSKLKIKGKSNIIAGGKYHNKKDLLSFPLFDKGKLSFRKKEILRHPDFKGEHSLFNVIMKKDVMIHMPYQSFDYITAFLREAAIDPFVKSISITLYRVSKDSDIVHALINAAKNGKKVTVVIELQARFDEENNIYYSDLLKDAGARVIFGAQGLKVHSKIILIQRKVDGLSRHIGYLGTGNFHEGNSKIYEDLGIFTASNLIVSDLKKLFSLFENAFQRIRFSSLVVSPFDTRIKFSELILNEILHAQRGKEAYINLKLNNLVDKQMINLLYQASKSGVKIKLTVRGICCLIPGKAGLSENIEVRSIVGRYLEHSRVIEFGNAGNPLIYISSADWMGRNLDKRIEVSMPVLDKKLISELRSYFALQWSDNQKSRIIDADQTNPYFIEGDAKIDAQQVRYNELKELL